MLGEIKNKKLQSGTVRTKARALLHSISLILPTLKPHVPFSSYTSSVLLILCHISVPRSGHSHGVSYGFLAFSVALLHGCMPAFLLCGLEPFTI